MMAHRLKETFYNYGSLICRFYWRRHKLKINLHHGWSNICLPFGLWTSHANSIAILAAIFVHFVDEQYNNQIILLGLLRRV